MSERIEPRYESSGFRGNADLTNSLQEDDEAALFDKFFNEAKESLGYTDYKAKR